MKGKASERGMASLSAVLMFVMVSVLIVAATVSRNLYLARDLHRSLFDKQAVWLLESASERALSTLSTTEDIQSIEPQQFQERIAPVYVMSDPLIDNATNTINERSIVANYGYHIERRDDSLAPEGFEKACVVHVTCSIPFRKSKILKEASYLCLFSKKRGWEKRPLVNTFF